MRRAPCGYCAGLAVGRPPCGRHFSPLKCRFYPSLPKRLEIARFQAFLNFHGRNDIAKLFKSAQESAQTLRIGALSFTNTREMGNGYHLGGAVPEIFIDNFTARWYSTREKTAMTEKSPQLSVQREARQVKGLYGRRRAVPLPSGRDDRDGTLPLQRDTKRRPFRPQAGWNRGA